MSSKMEDFGFLLTRMFATTKHRKRQWPHVPGNYYVCNPDAPVAVTTLGNAELAGQLAQNAPGHLCITGKVETENIGIEKIIKNVISNPAIRYLVCAGNEPPKHLTGATLMALFANGMDSNHRISGSPGMRPLLPNTTPEEVDHFRQQVVAVDMIGCNDVQLIVNRINELGEAAASSPTGDRFEMSRVVDDMQTEPIAARIFDPEKIKLDKAGYFVIQPRGDRILVEHYSNKEKFLRRIEGSDARNIYLTIINNGWVSRMDHAAYLGAQLMKAEISIRHGLEFNQDGA